MTSQRSVSEGSQKVRADNLTEDQLNMAVIKVTSFLVTAMKTKRKIRKEDVVLHALNKTARQYNLIMQRVGQNLANVFSLQISKLPKNDDSFIITNKSNQRFCNLVNEFTSIELGRDPSCTVLTFVLSSIFMSGGQIFEAHLMKLLELTGFFNDNYFRPIKQKNTKDYVTKLIKKVFVQQLYLDVSTVPRPEKKQNPPLPEDVNKVTIFRWGFRAYLEVDVESIKIYLKKLCDGDTPRGFSGSYYKEMKKKQEELRSNLN